MLMLDCVYDLDDCYMKGGQQSPVLRTGGAVKRPPMDVLTSN